MEIKISFFYSKLGQAQSATSYSVWETYKRKRMDKYIKNATVSHYIDGVIIKDAKMMSKKSVDDMIEFLTKARKSFIS